MNTAITVVYLLCFILALLGLKIRLEQIRLDKKIDAFRKTLDADKEKFLSAIEQLVEKQK